MNEHSGDLHDTTLGEVPAAPSSALAGLRAQRDKIKATLFIDIPVPRYSGVLVRFKPAPQGLVTKIMNAAEKSKDADAGVIANAQVLAHCAVGVFQLDDLGKPLGDPSDWPVFGHELAELIGAPEAGGTAVAVVRALYATDGDIAATAAALAEWSGYTAETVAADYEGNS
jgi:hypothetical protein